MCGRFTRTTDLKKIVEKYGVADGKFLCLKPQYNIAPSQQAAVLLQKLDRPPSLELFQWGLVPSWAKDSKIGQRMINARAETLIVKPSFRSLLAKQRCLIPADGFYEWKKEERTKRPYFIQRASGMPFALAGLWSCWRAPGGSELRSFTIITTQANDTMHAIHERMPVILLDEAQGRWLDPTQDISRDLNVLLAPYPGGDLHTYPVSTLVNSPANDVPECIQPQEIEP